MRVVELDRHLVRELRNVAVLFKVAVDQVLQRRRGEEILLTQPKLLAGGRRVARIQDFRDRLRANLFGLRRDIIAGVEDIETQGIGSARPPQSKRIHVFAAPAGYRRIVGDGLNDLGWTPDLRNRAVMERLHRASKADGIGDFGARELPRIAEGQPVFGIFVLPAVLDRLPEQAVIVADAIAIRGDGQRRHALHEAGSEASQAAIAERGIRLHLAQLVEIDVEAGQGLANRGSDPKIVQRVHEQTPDQKFKREIIDPTAVFFVICLLGCDPWSHDLVAHDKRGRDEPIPLAGRCLVFACCADKPLKDELAKTADIVTVCHSVVRARGPLLEIRFWHCLRHIPFLIALNARTLGGGEHLRHARRAPYRTPRTE